MPISKDLFLAILSMDSYNRGYGAGISDGLNVEGGVDLGLGDAIGKSIGNATVSNRVSSDPNGAAQDAGFYAIAYKLDKAVGTGTDVLAKDTTIISFRGTKYFSNNVVY